MQNKDLKVGMGPLNKWVTASAVPPALDHRTQDRSKFRSTRVERDINL